MRVHVKLSIAALGVCILGGTVLPRTIAAVFGARTLSQSRLIAIAVPRGQQFYSLLILEQLSNQRSCWREIGERPTRVEPLLLKFNFQGICGRSTDSNGYSLRRGDRDLGLLYRFRIERRPNELVLLGAPSQEGQNPTVLIGRTRGIAPGLLKIHLEPGWQFAKRTYQGKTLGHIYLSQPSYIPAQSTAHRAASRPSASAKPVQHRPIALPAPSQTTKPLSPRSAVSTVQYRVMVATPNPQQQAQVRSLFPTAFRRTYQGQTVMQIGLFSQREKAEELVKSLQSQGLRAIILRS